MLALKFMITNFIEMLFLAANNVCFRVTLSNKLLGEGYTGSRHVFKASGYEDLHVTFDLEENSPEIQAFANNVNSARCAC